MLKDLYLKDITYQEVLTKISVIINKNTNILA